MTKNGNSDICGLECVEQRVLQDQSWGPLYQNKHLGNYGCYICYFIL